LPCPPGTTGWPHLQRVTNLLLPAAYRGQGIRGNGDSGDICSGPVSLPWVPVSAGLGPPEADRDIRDTFTGWRLARPALVERRRRRVHLVACCTLLPAPRLRTWRAPLRSQSSATAPRPATPFGLAWLKVVTISADASGNRPPAAVPAPPAEAPTQTPAGRAAAAAPAGSFDPVTGSAPLTFARVW